MLVDSVGSGMRLSADSAMSLARRCASVKHRLAKSFQSCSSQYCTSGATVSTFKSVLAQDGEHVFVAAASAMEIASHQKYTAAWRTRQQSAAAVNAPGRSISLGVFLPANIFTRSFYVKLRTVRKSPMSMLSDLCFRSAMLCCTAVTVTVRSLCRAYVSGGRQRITVRRAGAAQATCHGVHATTRAPSSKRSREQGCHAPASPCT